MASALPQQVAVHFQNQAPTDAEMSERVRKLEDLVSRMHEQMQRLNQELAALKQQPPRR
jgi:hypothetical protein